MNAHYRRLLLEQVFDLLDGPRRSEIIGRAHNLIALWRSTPHMAPYYADRWQYLLTLPVEQARAIVLGDTDEGDMLRHCMPFAGVVDNKQRQAVRRMARSI
ncbi:hypothetical protein [Devosia sp. Root635]|uniref:hypothetical protein n=1 Tax=Devosia sp. Root635 TaxID=1736575 RepID=UPI0006FFE653|nr:hypothetical protein [Devosia sp. Root635]KRA47699.1 hypothetical protein ASD80_02555 [Devosia sp. Root635]